MPRLGYSWLLVSLLWIVLAGSALAEEERRDDVSLIIPFGPGGASDVLFRDLARAAEPHLGFSLQPVNRPGNGGVRGALEVKEAEPDGHTLLASHQALSLSFLSGAAPFSHVAFEPVALLTRTVNIPAASRSLGITSAAELVVHIQEHPGALRVGMIRGATDHFFWRQFSRTTGLPVSDIGWVGYPDTGAQVAALLAGEIDLAMLNLPSGELLFTHGALVPLGVADQSRISALPKVPTLKEQGIDLVNTTDRELFAPRGSDPAFLEQVAAAFGKALEQPTRVEHLERDYGTRVDFRPLEKHAAYLEAQAYNLASRMSEVP
ncbi:tripartite tricarboxylate transporter substrate binding protein [Halomonas sp. LR5S13]|uniref:Bug family tripartite tricarboxylate transporter substrate binding protein n=1 Tax=Halomonas rhizosphaerae TaxID=3043296 RepID=UPI0024A9A193|nr:tripartite tricarboxylate transporter substrate binding protein [Halomonas rhizosphaerae]MDI5922773.1 tripartite tricarboxylate transporter substrate binding protein [Halomonas rhizosphaerae]